VYKKEKNCDENNPSDTRRGDNWDHVSLDAETKLVLQVVNGKRTKKKTELLVQKTAKRLGNKPPRLMTSDDYKPYKEAILKAFGKQRTPRRTGKRGRPKKASYRPPPDLVYATVCKQRVKGRVNKIVVRTVFGTDEQVATALKVTVYFLPFCPLFVCLFSLFTGKLQKIGNVVKHISAILR